MKEITVQELKQMLDSKSDFQLIDVREPYELEIASIGGDPIPMGEVMNKLDKINRSKPVVIYCRSGKRSGVITNALEAQGFSNVHNLQGGILAWSDQIDSSIQKY